MRLPFRPTLLGIALILTAVIAGCSRPDTQAASGSATNGPDEATSAAVSLPSPEVLADIGAAEALRLANEWRSQYPAISTQLTTRAVVFAYPDRTEYRVALPNDQMVVAIAPFIQGTHPCEIHSISGCRGELQRRDFDVLVTGANGTYVEETITTMESGFLEIWLPRDQTFTIEIHGMDRSARGEISTSATSPTCLTGFRLEA